MTTPTQLPDEHGRFGPYQYITETLMAAVAELEVAYREARADPEFEGERPGGEASRRHCKAFDRHIKA